MASGNRFSFLFFTILLLTISPTSHSISFTQYRNLFSLAHSLTTRIANLRAARGDAGGSTRARLIAQKLERGLGLGFWGVTWSMGWDYLRNYAWRDASPSEIFGALSDINELMRGLNELTRMESEMERVAWVQRNYKNFLRISKSLISRLLMVFGKSGPLRELLETMREEVMEGDLLRDCLEVGSNDLQGLVQIFKDIALQYSSSARTELLLVSEIGPTSSMVRPLFAWRVATDLETAFVPLGVFVPGWTGVVRPELRPDTCTQDGRGVPGVSPSA